MAETLTWLHANEAAMRLGVSPQTVRRWALVGVLEGRRLGPKLVQVTEASVDHVLGDRLHPARPQGA